MAETHSSPEKKVRKAEAHSSAGHTNDKEIDSSVGPVEDNLIGPIWSDCAKKKLISQVHLWSVDKFLHQLDVNGENIPWEDIAFEQFSAEDCKSCWLQELSQVAVFKTTKSHAAELLDTYQCIPSRQKQIPAIKKANAEFNPVARNPIKKIPDSIAVQFAKKKRLAGYTLFSKHNMPQMHSFKEVSEAWKILPDSEKDVYRRKADLAYEDHLKEWDEYIANHPEDTTAFDLRAKIRYPKTKTTKETSKRKKHVGKESDDHSASPKKKAKKESKVREAKSALDMFINIKKEEFILSHPDVKTVDVLARLAKKFNKLKDSKKAKYERLAVEAQSG